MSRSIRLDIASIAILSGVFLSGPIAFASLWISAVLGVLAARNGSRWWLLVPGAIFVCVGSMFFLAVNSY